MVIVKVTMSNGNTLCQYELNTVRDGEEVLTNTKWAIKAINPDLDVDIYDETNNSVEAVIHNIMHDVIGYCAKNTRWVADAPLPTTPSSLLGFAKFY